MVMRDRWAIMSEGTSLHAGTRLIEIIGARPARENGGMKPPAGGGKPDRSSGPPSIPRVFCGTREGCIEWSSMRMCGVVSMWKG